MSTTSRCLAGIVLSILVVASVAGSNQAGKDYLEQNANKEGVVVLPSGMQYKVLNKGSGAFSPTADSTCTCHYHGTTPDGSVFDSSIDRKSPIDFAPNQVIKGWTEAMQMMVEGDKWELYIPSDLAYGDGGSGAKIKGGDTLIFIIELIEIKGDKVPALKCTVNEAGDMTDCSEKEAKYIKKWLEKDGDDTAMEHIRLEGMVKMKNSGTKPDLQNWMYARLHILDQILNPREEL